MIFWNQNDLDRNSDKSIDMIALGDSWFFYPKNNLLNAIDRNNRCNIYALGQNGERADGMKNYLRELKSFLKTYKTIKAVAISAGGNDFAGLGDLDKKILNQDCSRSTDINACYQSGQPHKLFEETMKHYQEILNTIITYGQLPVGHITVFVHNYDFPIPDGKALQIAGRTIGPWLKEPMDKCKVVDDDNPTSGFRYQLCVDLIKKFTQKLEGLADKYQNNQHIRVEFIQSAGTLSSTEWVNELHPSSSGFQKIVENCWRNPVNKIFNSYPPGAGYLGFGRSTETGGGVSGDWGGSGWNNG